MRTNNDSQYMWILSRHKSVICIVLLFLLAMSIYIYLSNFGYSTTSSQNYHINNGDIVLISGRSWRNAIVRFFDGSTSNYSHTGIIRLVSGVPHIIHANPLADAIQMGPLSEYLAADIVIEAVLYRLVGMEEQAKVASEVSYSYYENNYPFDHSFSLSSDNKIYCTELVWKAYKKAGTTLLPVPSFNNDILWPAQLLNCNKLTKIATLK